MSSDSDYDDDFRYRRKSTPKRPTNPVARMLHEQANQLSNQRVLHRPVARRPDTYQSPPSRSASPAAHTLQTQGYQLPYRGDLRRPRAIGPDSYQNQRNYFNSYSRPVGSSTYSSNMYGNQLKSQSFSDRLRSYNGTVPIYRITPRNSGAYTSHSRANYYYNR